MQPGQVVLGLDPGVESLGWALAIVGPDGKLYRKSHGCSSTLASDSMPRRIDLQCQAIEKLLQSRPAVIAVEAWVPYAGGRRGAGQNTMRMCGAVRAMGILSKVPVIEYTAQAVKGILLGDRNASKAEVQAAVKSYFDLPKIPRPNHAADALAVCVAHFVAQADGTDVVSKSVKYAAARGRRGMVAA